MISSELTLLHAGAQLGDLDGQAVDAVLEWVGTHIKGVGLVKKLPKNIFCMFTCNQSEENEGRRRVVDTQKGVSNLWGKERSAAYFMTQKNTISYYDCTFVNPLYSLDYTSAFSDWSLHITAWAWMAHTSTSSDPLNVEAIIRLPLFVSPPTHSPSYLRYEALR